MHGLEPLVCHVVRLLQKFCLSVDFLQNVLHLLDRILILLVTSGHLLQFFLKQSRFALQIQVLLFRSLQILSLHLEDRLRLLSLRLDGFYVLLVNREGLLERLAIRPHRHQIGCLHTGLLILGSLLYDELVLPHLHAVL